VFAVTFKTMRIRAAILQIGVYRLFEFGRDVFVTVKARPFKPVGQLVLACDVMRRVARSTMRDAFFRLCELAVNPDVITRVLRGAAGDRRVHAIMAFGARTVDPRFRQRRFRIRRILNIMRSMARRAFDRAFVSAHRDFLRRFGVTCRALHGF
jgi:hypothetical protein